MREDVDLLKDRIVKALAYNWGKVQSKHLQDAQIVEQISQFAIQRWTSHYVAILVFNVHTLPQIIWDHYLELLVQVYMHTLS